MRLESAKLLFDAATAARHIQGITSGRHFEEYEADIVLRAAVERFFMILGEALAQLRTGDPDTFDAIPHASRAVGMRNILVHGYSKVDDAVVWSTAVNDLPSWLAAIDAMLP